MVLPAAEPVEAQQPLVCSKQPFKEPSVPRKIKQILFNLMSPAEIVKTGEFHVYERGLYKLPERKVLPNGVLDQRLGVSNKQALCQTCGQKLAECTGHFGYIKLELPVFHIGYMKSTIATLQCICKKCSRVLLPEEERRKHLRQFRNPRLERMQRVGLFKKILDKCKRVKYCAFCGEFNGVVKKATGSLKIIHDKFNPKNASEHNKYMDEFEDALRHNDQIRPHLNKVMDDLHPIRVLALFTAIPAEDCELLDLSGRPEHLIMTHLAVPPVCIRPSVEMDTGAGSNEDDITMKLMQIIEVNNILRQGLEKGLPVANLMENYDFLQMQCAMYINSDLPGLPLAYQNPGKPLRGFVQRLKGKQGRFRGNLSGKRVDFSGRTVISPDPNLRVDEVAVPERMAVVLTYPERVTDHNIEKLRKCVLNGMGTWPGANFVLFPDGGRWFLKYGDRRRIASELKVGDTVERHLQNGDIVLFNRQPSLHRMSIMAHRARVMPWRTLRFNECVCNPYNADFDGDEMNLHVPQTEEARTEAIQLMGVMNNLCTPKNGEILIAATQDFLTSAYLVTSKDAFFTRAEFCLACSYMGDALDQVDLPTPAIVRPIELWTGKQLFSVMIRPNAQTRLFINLDTVEKIHDKGTEQMCPHDGYVCFRNSELISGRLGKATLGGGNKAGLFQVLNTDYSARAAAQVMNRLAKFSARYIGDRGFSIGIDDVTPALVLVKAKQAEVDGGYGKVQDYIRQYAKGQLQLLSGCNMEQSLESSVTGILNGIREKAAQVCMTTLHWHNSPLIMSRCGSKGSPINIAQMVACVGQQSVGGKRCPDGFKGRTLPHFPRGDRTPEGKGFVASSFYSGLSPTEFFFHTMGGREGLVDTAVKTAETGYMSRRLMKALEDLYTHYDGTVRNAANGIVQLTYGDDNLDPVSMEGKDGQPLDLTRALQVVRATTPHGSAAGEAGVAGMLPAELEAFVERELQAAGLHPGTEFCSNAFRASVRDFLLKEVSDLRAKRGRLGLPEDGARGDLEVELAASLGSISAAEVHNFVRLCTARYESKRMDPGSTVGAFGAQSIGEPGTQMTLKTFHFAGVASMNVTLGVPRIKEIINASKNISTPIIEVAMDVDNSLQSARVVKARLEKTALGDIAKSLKAVLHPNGAYLAIKLNMDTISALQLDVDPATVARAIVAAPKLKLKPEHIRIVGADKLEVKPPEEGKRETKAKKELFFQVQELLQALPRVIVQGIASVERAVINKVDGDKYKLFVEGTNLKAVMATLGVKGCESTTNHVMEAEKYLGIEAARSTIMSQINEVMSAHGMQIDTRHTMLLADCMTYKGEVLGITRFGIAKMKDSVLMLASFEKTTDHLFDAALHGRCDDITGVSESIIMGIPMPTGTGLFKLRHSCSTEVGPQRPPPLLSY
ncbi:hypothetical protein WJX72_000381 [[Myrmecia] bisecta]|uniref:DNA-directed RNA polymerase subunit n=1 Tax=[Myrmecia] bisecta TaxID=41462 RepID=A0AAW1QE02_9CHLO